MRSVLASLALIAVALVATDGGAVPPLGRPVVPLPRAPAPVIRRPPNVAVLAPGALRIEAENADTARLAPLAGITGRINAALSRDPRTQALRTRIAQARSARSSIQTRAMMNALGPDIVALRSSIAENVHLTPAEIALLGEQSGLILTYPLPHMHVDQPGDLLSTVVITSFPDREGSKSESHCPDDDDTWSFSGAAMTHVTASGGWLDRDCSWLWAGKGTGGDPARGTAATVQAPPDASTMKVSFTGSVDLDAWAANLVAFGIAQADFEMQIRAPDGGAAWPTEIGGVIKYAPEQEAALVSRKAIDVFPSPIPALESSYVQTLQDGDADGTTTFNLPADRTTNTFELVPTVHGSAITGYGGEAWMNATITTWQLKVTFYR